MQIRDGLHMLGVVAGGPAADRHAGRDRPRAALGRAPGGRSLHRAIAADLGLGFDPLDCDLAAAWTGPRPARSPRSAMRRGARGDT